MESFCNLDLAPETAAAVEPSPAHGHTTRHPSSSIFSHTNTCDAFNLLKHSWDTTSAVALSSLAASTAPLSKTYATPRSKDLCGSLPQATPFPLSSLSSSFLPPPPSPISTLASSALPLPASPPHPPRTSHSLLETARRLPNDAAAYRVRPLSTNPRILDSCICSRCFGSQLFMLHKFKATLSMTTLAPICARCSHFNCGTCGGVLTCDTDESCCRRRSCRCVQPHDVTH